MDRCAVFADAGYLFAEGGKLCLGTSVRQNIRLDHRGISDYLARLSGEHSGLEHLRTYWYDGARDRSPTPSHLSVAHLSRVKLRLGNLKAGGQKGVDSRIVRDLIVLSRNRAIAAAFVLGGDEDLMEGVAQAQEWGIPVFIVGIDPAGEDENNQSAELLREADDVILLGEDELGEFFELREDPSTETKARELGRVFASDLKEELAEEELESIERNRPRIPGEIDARLLQGAEEELGSLWGNKPLRHALREGFWKEF